MCMKCESAHAKLETFLEQLNEEIPGTTVEGTQVTDDHHISVALAVALGERPYGQRILRKMAQDLLDEAFERANPGGGIPAPQGRVN